MVDSRYQLVAGERRWRAAKLAGVALVPVVVREIPEDRLLEITLIENIQREDLNPMETAGAFARLAAELNLNAEQIGLRTGKDRSTVINLMRLQQLPEDLQQLISEGKLTAGHGRCLLSLPTADLQREVGERAVAGAWSVRQVEVTCARMTAGKTPKHVDEAKIDPNVKAAIHEMERKLGTRIQVKEGARGRGRLEIEYYSAEDLDRIYDAIMGEA
jgi:ParB family chromosome partitioning protein